MEVPLENPFFQISTKSEKGHHQSATTTNLIQICDDIDEKTCPILKIGQNVAKGTTVLNENCLIFGPKPFKTDAIPCVGCYRLQSKGLNQVRCPQCKWPCCDLNCPKLKQDQYHNLECDILAKTKFSTQNFPFEIVTALRALITLKKPLGQSQIQLPTTERISDLKEICKNAGIPTPSDDELSRLMGGIKRFGFVRDDVWCVYPMTGLVRHSCQSNCVAVIDDSYRMTLTLTDDLRKGDELTVGRVNLLLGTQERLYWLQMCNLRLCNCARCRDPTEFGSYLSALRCFGTSKQCACGGTQLPTKPHDLHTKWYCHTCQIRLPSKDVWKFVRHLRQKVDSALWPICRRNIRELQDLVDKLLQFFHPNHYLVVRVQMALLDLYVPDYCTDLDRKLELCDQLLDMFSKLDPAHAHLWWEYCQIGLKKLQFFEANLSRQKGSKTMITTNPNDLLCELKALLQERLLGSITVKKLHEDLSIINL